MKVQSSLALRILRCKKEWGQGLGGHGLQRESGWQWRRKLHDPHARGGQEKAVTFE